MSEAEGNKVWLDYTQEELDYKYNQRALALDFQVYLDRYDTDSKRARATLACRRDIAFGPSEDENLDIFTTDKPDAPVVVFIHGGAWMRQSKEMVSYPAEAFVAAGAHYVAVNFGLVPAVTLDEQVRQARASIAWVYRNAQSFGADPEQLYVVGHSSGAHVAGMTIVTDWDTGYDLPRNVIKGAMSYSGMYELEPVRLSSRNEYMHLDHAAVDRNSSIRRIPSDGPPLIIGSGGGEHEEFQRQSKEFAEAWRAAGLSCREINLPGFHHFAVSFEFVRPGSEPLAAMLELMKL